MEHTRTWSFRLGKGEGSDRLFLRGGAIGGCPVMNPLFFGGSTGLKPPFISIVCWWWFLLNFSPLGVCTYFTKMGLSLGMLVEHVIA